MYNNNTNVNGYKKLSPNATQKQKEEYLKLVESVDDGRYININEDEWNGWIDNIEKEYIKRNPSVLNESDAYWGVSPFDWIKSINLKGIFAPLKWLAALLAGGLALLIAALYKALKEGKKQIAIAKVRQWIKSLVVTADGGYKKTRKTKDSLFLIQARARRDILQAAVMSGYAAGLDIPEKHNEPANPVESAKNESMDLNGMDGFLFEDSATGVYRILVYKGKEYQDTKNDWMKLMTELNNDGVSFDEANIKEFYTFSGMNSKPQEKTFDETEKKYWTDKYDVNIDIKSIQSLIYKDKTYNVDINGLDNLVKDMKTNGDDISIAPLEITTKDNPTYRIPLDKNARNYFQKKIQNIQNQNKENQKNQETTNKQKEIDLVKDCKEFVSKDGTKYPNNVEGLLQLYNDLQSNGFNPSNADSFPSLSVVSNDDTVIPINFIESKKTLSNRLVFVKKNENDKIKAQESLDKERKKQEALDKKEEDKQKIQSEIDLVNNTEKFWYKEKEYTNSAEGLTQLDKDFCTDGFHYSKPDSFPKIYAFSDGQWVEINSIEAKRSISNRFTSIRKCQGDLEKAQKELDKIKEKEDKEKQKEELLKNREGVNQMLNKSYDQDIELPDDSQVDWSLMNTLKTSSWFGLVKHKTDLWKEAKSVYKMSIDDIETENDRQQYITNVITNVNAALSKITTPSIARNYTNVLNQMVTNMLNRTTNGSRQMMSRDSAANTGIKIGGHGGYNESMNIDSYINYLNEATINQNNQSQNQRQGTSININVDDLFGNQNKREVEIDYDKSKNLLDNTYKAMQNIFTANPSTDFLVYKKTSEQMNNFLNELTKSVHLIIDSVAKKVADQTHNSNNSVDRAITSFLSDKGDPKQNRSLKNLWDNIGRPQLDSRAVTRCQSLTQSPEFTWYIEILTNTIPLCVMKIFTESFVKNNSLISTSNDEGVKNSDSSILTNGVNNQNNQKNENRLKNQNNPEQNSDNGNENQDIDLNTDSEEIQPNNENEIPNQEDLQWINISFDNGKLYQNTKDDWFYFYGDDGSIWKTQDYQVENPQWQQIR